jgi:hypothetical protein
LPCVDRGGSQRSDAANRWAAALPLQEFFDGEADVSSNFAKQGRRDVATGMEGNRRASPIRVPELAMRSALSDLLKPDAQQERGDFARLQDRYGPHVLGDLDRL